MIEMVSNFKDRFNQALEIRGIKAIEISERTGISEATLSQYKNGYSKPKDKRLAKLANVLDVNVSWLMGLNVPMNPMPDNISIADDGTVLSEEDRELLNRFHRIRPSTRETIDLLIEADLRKP